MTIGHLDWTTTVDKTGMFTKTGPDKIIRRIGPTFMLFGLFFLSADEKRSNDLRNGHTGHRVNGIYSRAITAA
jgi:hypothetical protein